MLDESDIDSFLIADLCLHAHNVLRALHQNTGPMVWDEELARGSEQYARQLASEGRLRHSRGNYGENLYAAWGQSASCAKATLSWYVAFLNFILKSYFSYFISFILVVNV